jgi:hypothetical protein
MPSCMGPEKLKVLLKTPETVLPTEIFNTIERG